MLYAAVMTAHGCDPSTREDKERGLQIQSEPDLYQESEASLGYIVRICLNK